MAGSSKPQRVCTKCFGFLEDMKPANRRPARREDDEWVQVDEQEAAAVQRRRDDQGENAAAAGRPVAARPR